MKAVVADKEKLKLLCFYMYEKTQVQFDPNMVQGFAVISDTGDFAAAVIVSNVRYSGDVAVDCEISCAAETSIAWKPTVLRAVFQYVFGQLGCVRCTSIVLKKNTRSREFLEALNFQLEGRLRKAYDGTKDALIYGLLAEECAYFKDLAYGEEIGASSADAA